MSVAAEKAVCDWINAPITGLVGQPPAQPGPLSAGAVTVFDPKSPAQGAYAVISRIPGGSRRVVAEQSDLDLATISALVYDHAADAAELAAQALVDAIRSLSGLPTPMGTTAVCLVSDNVSGPATVPMPQDLDTLFCFQVTADFLLRPA